MNRKYWKIAGIVCVVVLAVAFVFKQYVRGAIQKNGIYSSSRIYHPYRYNPDQSYHYDRYYATESNNTQHVNLNLNVKDFFKTQAYLDLIISKYSGRAIRLYTYQPPDATKTGTLIFEIAPYYLGDVLTDIRSLGQVRSEANTDYWNVDSWNANAWNSVAPQVSLNQLKEQRDRLLQVYSQQTNEAESRRINEEISRLSQEIQSLESNINTVQAQPVMVTITVQFVEKKFSLLKASRDFMGGLAKALSWSMMLVVNMVNGLITILVFVLPLAVWISLISLIIFFILKTSKCLPGPKIEGK